MTIEMADKVASRQARALAEKFRKEGYAASAQPANEFLPEFLRPFRPDLVIEKDGEKHVIMVVTPEERFEEGYVEALYAAVATHPEWHVGMATAMPKPHERYSFKVLPGMASLADRLATAERLLAEQPLEVALLYAWALFEAAARARLMEVDHDPFRPHTALGLIDLLISEGYIGQARGPALRRGHALREAAERGYFDVPITVADVRLVLDTVRGLLDPNGPSNEMLDLED